MSTIHTVTGPCRAADLGITLMHEHLIIGWPGWESDGAAPVWDRAEAKRMCVDRMQELKALGVTALVDPCPIDLGRDVDVVLMRQDPPFDLGYLTGTWLLERIRGETLVVNDPVSVRNAPEKVFVLDFPEFMPPTMVTRDLDAVKDFQARYGAVVIKPLHGNGGKAVFRIDADGANLGALVELFGQVWPEPFMVQQFLPSVSQGDKRIVLIDGAFAGAINRKPGEGEFRSNLAVGGYAEAAALTPREQEICDVLGPALRERGLLFVGIDVIGGEWLTEINVTSPTGIVAIDRFDNVDTAAMIWDAIERRIG